MSDVLHDEHGCLYDREKHDPDAPTPVLLVIVFWGLLGTVAIYLLVNGLLWAYDTVLAWFS